MTGRSTETAVTGAVGCTTVSVAVARSDEDRAWLLLADRSFTALGRLFGRRLFALRRCLLEGLASHRLGLLRRLLALFGREWGLLLGELWLLGLSRRLRRLLGVLGLLGRRWLWLGVLGLLGRRWL